jgi:hypothetical protein
MDQEQTSERQEEQAEATGNGSPDDKSEAVQEAQKAEQESEEAKEKVRELEEDPPEKLEDWPDDKAKYETFGGAEGNESYEESVTSKLGPSSLRFREDGGVEVEGEEVDDPQEYKSDPIPGGPTDPKMKDSRAYGEPDLTEETSQDVTGEGEGESAGAEEESSSSSSDDGGGGGGAGGADDDDAGEGEGETGGGEGGGGKSGGGGDGGGGGGGDGGS